MVRRVFVEKKAALAVEADGLKNELRSLLNQGGLQNLRIVQRYDVQGLSAEDFKRCLPVVFSEPPVDVILDAEPVGDFVFCVEYLPGQFDQRAESAAECAQLLCGGERPVIRSARVYALDGKLSDAEREAVKKYIINPVEAREADSTLPQTLEADYLPPPDIEVLEGFGAADGAALAEMVGSYGLAMDAADLACCRDYFRTQGRDPSLTELRVLDTYWSDHCRHTTFLTRLTDIEIDDPAARESYALYQALRREIYGEREAARPVTLMDIATIGAKALKARGLLQNLDESDEINACSVRVRVDVDGNDEDWLLLFKNETHNHPTEIEPFGGAATCLGGAIRDPLSGRAYVYQAMRVTGAGDPLVPVGETLPGKLPQRKLVTAAAAGYSSYGNQIGLATGLVREIYHPGYVAKRMEIGAVVGAVAEKNVRRETPSPGDIVILVGGRTGRDGCGGATGSSKAHAESSIEICGAEVQKGNPPVERKLQRLFRNPEALRRIKRCNDFGAGGVAVAIGELSDGLEINLDAVPRKYEGLDGTELAISESQERMAVVVGADDAARFIELAAQENLEATIVAAVTGDRRLVMRWRGKVIVDLSRDFLDTNGAAREAAVRVAARGAEHGSKQHSATLAQRMEAVAGDLNACSQKGLGERFDSTIGAASVLLPFGGKHQLSPAGAMAALLPVNGATHTCSGMTYGFDPYLSEQNPHNGAYLAVVHSAAKLVAAGFPYRNIYLTFQEYFARPGGDPARWGAPFAALLGALRAQIDLGLAAIGGKDSMSGSFEQLDVPPTLVSFAVSTGREEQITGTAFCRPGSRLAWFAPRNSGALPDAGSFRQLIKQVEELVAAGAVRSACAPGRLGIAQAVIEMAAGNCVGVELAPGFDSGRLFERAVGGILLELDPAFSQGDTLGTTVAEYALRGAGETVDLARIQRVWQEKLEPVFPTTLPSTPAQPFPLNYEGTARRCNILLNGGRPRALIPAFPGTNCETDTAAALERAGAETEIFIVRNLTPDDVVRSAGALAERIRNSQMIVLPGGFSGGDEPEGSAKLITAFFRGAEVAQAVMELLEVRDGLMLGICNGFQALVKLGLVPFGKIIDSTPDSPTLTFNRIGRHQSGLVRTRVASTLSPWLLRETVGAVHTIAISHGEGRFVCGAPTMERMIRGGQIAAQYVGLDGRPSNDIRYNPNGSVFAIEAVTSPDGRVLGKMGHTERSGPALYRNVPLSGVQQLFESGVDYFKI